MTGQKYQQTGKPVVDLDGAIGKIADLTPEISWRAEVAWTCPVSTSTAKNVSHYHSLLIDNIKVRGLKAEAVE